MFCCLLILPRGHVIHPNVRSFQLSFQLAIGLPHNESWEIQVRTYGNSYLRKHRVLLGLHFRVKVEPAEILVNCFDYTRDGIAVTMLNRVTGFGVGPGLVSHP